MNSDNLLFILIIVLIFYNSYRFNSFYPNLFVNDKSDKSKSKSDKSKSTESDKYLNNIKNELKEIKETIKNIKTEDDIERRDIDVIHNLRHPPERRVSKDEYLTHQIQKIVNIPTRGYPDDYQMLGVLSRESDEKMLNLFGRQRHPGSDIWEYYVSDNSNNPPTKIPIDINNNRELLENNTMINLPVFDASKGKFKLILYKFDTPRYLP